ncbi:hypothetical protein P4E94_02395 [Pontiellaceae bacterium B12219]|nr:hypothetical protein [Pontiellaceae bacterium B12219]
MAKIEISGPTLVDEGATATFVCSATYSDGNKEDVVPVWSEDSSSSSISANGVLSAGDILADESVSITATFGGKTATVGVLIRYIAPTLDHLVISGPSAVNEGASGIYSCVAHFSDGANVPVTPVWSASSTSVMIDGNGTLEVLSIDNDQMIDVVAAYGGQTQSYSVALTDVPLVLEDITIQGAVSMDENSTIQLNCIALYSDGSQPLIEPVWAENSAFAQISQDGRLSAGDVTANQAVTVSASFGGVSDTHSVLINYVAPNIERIEISGPLSLDEGSSAAYSCSAYYDDGTSKSVTPSWSEDSEYATVSSSGVLMASDVQSDQVLTLSATFDGKSDSMQVAIVYDAPTVVSLIIDGAMIVEEHNETRYVCMALFSDGTSERVVPVWSISEEWAQIDSDGVLRVGEVNRDESVTLSASFGGSTDTYNVLLKDVPPAAVLESLSVSGLSEVMERESTVLVCTAHYSDGSSFAVTPVWSDNSKVATVSSAGEFSAGNFDSDSVVEVTASFGGMTATHQITVRMIGTEIIYPLSGFDGSAVKAELYDYETAEWRTYGPVDSPSELVLDDMSTNQWYWVSVLESNTTSNVWVEVQGNWLNL